MSFIEFFILDPVVSGLEVVVFSAKFGHLEFEAPHNEIFSAFLLGKSDHPKLKLAPTQQAPNEENT